MNKLMIASIFAMGGAAAFAVPAFAQTAPTTQSSGTTSAQPVATAQRVATAQPAKKAPSVPSVESRHCLRYTGSHIRPAKGQCMPGIGGSYSVLDLDRTGAATLGQALQALDSSIVID